MSQTFKAGDKVRCVVECPAFDAIHGGEYIIEAYDADSPTYFALEGVGPANYPDRYLFRDAEFELVDAAPLPDPVREAPIESAPQDKFSAGDLVVRRAQAGSNHGVGPGEVREVLSTRWDGEDLWLKIAGDDSDPSDETHGHDAFWFDLASTIAAGSLPAEELTDVFNDFPLTPVNMPAAPTLQDTASELADHLDKIGEFLWGASGPRRWAKDKIESPKFVAGALSDEVLRFADGDHAVVSEDPAFHEARGNVMLRQALIQFALSQYATTQRARAIAEEPIVIGARVESEGCCIPALA
jgi:hypothetical protein